MKLSLLAVLLVAAGSAHCQSMPPPKTTLVDASLYAGVITTRSLDYITTEHVLAGGGKELILPNSLVRNKPLFAAFSIGSGVGEVFAARMLARHGHRTMARMMLCMDISVAGAVAAHNASISTPNHSR